MSKKKKVNKRKTTKKRSKNSAGKKVKIKATKKTSPAVGPSNEKEVG